MNGSDGDDSDDDNDDDDDNEDDEDDERAPREPHSCAEMTCCHMVVRRRNKRQRMRTLAVATCCVVGLLKHSRCNTRLTRAERSASSGISGGLKGAVCCGGSSDTESEMLSSLASCDGDGGGGGDTTADTSANTACTTLSAKHTRTRNCHRLASSRCASVSEHRANSVKASTSSIEVLSKSEPSSSSSTWRTGSASSSSSAIASRSSSKRGSSLRARRAKIASLVASNDGSSAEKTSSVLCSSAMRSMAAACESWSCDRSGSELRRDSISTKATLSSSYDRSSSSVRARASRSRQTERRQHNLGARTSCHRADWRCDAEYVRFVAMASALLANETLVANVRIDSRQLGAV